MIKKNKNWALRPYKSWVSVRCGSLRVTDPLQKRMMSFRKRKRLFLIKIKIDLKKRSDAFPLELILLLITVYSMQKIMNRDTYPAASKISGSLKKELNFIYGPENR